MVLIKSTAKVLFREKFNQQKPAIPLIYTGEEFMNFQNKICIHLIVKIANADLYFLSEHYRNLYRTLRSD